MYTLFNQKPTFNNLLLLFIFSFFIRSATMLFFIQPGGYYNQPDSPDYHNCAISVALGKGMHRLDNNDPIFWRTPGYPIYLAQFYKLHGVKSTIFKENQSAQKSSIWVQIFLSSFIPLIIFFLAFIICQSYPISWAVAWLSSIHLGFVLASTFLLTEGVALIFFYLFLCFLFKNIFISQKKHRWMLSIILAAISLSLYTWIRPMGEVIALVSTGLLLFAGIGNIKQKVLKSSLFFIVFFISIFPWYVRNYKLTDEWFFNPTIGPYFTCFCAPKVMSHVTGKPLIDCWRECQQRAAMELRKKAFFKKDSGKFISPLASKNAMISIIKEGPGWFVLDWLQETIKTTFDLYSYQLVAMMNDTFWYDPLQEFLSEKIAGILWTEDVPFLVRLIGWIEFLFSLFLWFGLFAGIWQFIFKPFFAKEKSQYHRTMQKIWIVCGIMIGAIIAPTGGFGYARLRLPAEPLLLILSLMFWFWFFNKKYSLPSTSSGRTEK